MFTSLFEQLDRINSIASNEPKESWGNLTFEGRYNLALGNSCFESLYNALTHLELDSSINFFIENSPMSFTNFMDELSENDNWKISINKNVSINKPSDLSNTFFYSKDKFIEWAKKTNPFNADYPLNSKKSFIQVKGLNNSFGGPNFIVSSSLSCLQDVNWDNYDEAQIIENIHIVSKSLFILKPLNHYISFGQLDEASEYFFRNSILVLLASLSNEIYDNGTLIIKGYRRISLILGLKYYGSEITEEYQEILADAVRWIYQKTERCDLRLKLLLERITLDIDYSLPYIQGLFTVIEDATIQAKERYSFIIYDRKDLFQRELKDLLKDIKSLTDAFSLKIRNILSNLLRDVLAAFILVGITFFSKVSEIEKLFENRMIKYVFFAFGVYFIGSAILQSIVDGIDLWRSNKEFDYWKKISREYMSKKDYINHRKETIDKRLNWFIFTYIIIILLYVAVGILCFSLPGIWDRVMTPETINTVKPQLIKIIAK
ncbi:hypothetical protein [uncultured Bacteroides sp.]|uniref:hypothetical protein n=1 Tax=uncultured Bacteroides sp. TaxID=162156 RepID=UPI002AA8A066|nr:hypothetical protein [uncultured Bacteroides sp.]